MSLMIKRHMKHRMPKHVGTAKQLDCYVPLTPDTKSYKHKGSHSVDKYDPRLYLQKTHGNTSAILAEEPSFYEYKLHIRTTSALPLGAKLPPISQPGEPTEAVSRLQNLSPSMVSVHELSNMQQSTKRHRRQKTTDSPYGLTNILPMSNGGNKSCLYPQTKLPSGNKSITADSPEEAASTTLHNLNRSSMLETAEEAETHKKRMQRKWRKLTKRTVFSFQVDMLNNTVAMKRELRPGAEDDVEERVKEKILPDEGTLSPHLQKKRAGEERKRRPSIRVYYNPKEDSKDRLIGKMSGGRELPALVLRTKLKDNLKINMKVRKFIQKGVLETAFDLEQLDFAKMDPANYLSLYLTVKNAMAPTFYCSGVEELNKVDSEVAELIQHKESDRANLSPYDEAILSAYYACLEQVEKEQALCGFWQVRKVYGQKPTCRESPAMVSFEDKYYLFGGFGVDRLNDLWCLHAPTDTMWSWSLIHPLGSRVPSKRYGHCMAGWKANLYVFAGAGEFFPGVKMRIVLGDLWKYSIEDNVWQEFDVAKEKFEKRAHAASCVAEGLWFIHGGTSGSETLSSTAVFNFDTEKFIEFIIPGKTKLSDKIGPISHHVAVPVFPSWLTKRPDNTDFWFRYHKWGFLPTDALTSEKIGIYLLGGMVSQFEYNSSVWIIRCNSQRTNALLLADPGRKAAMLNKYIVDVERLKIEGPTPAPRAFPTAVFYMKYIVVFGGRNDREEGLTSHCLNDVCFLDLDTLRWQMIVVYGFVPSPRWGHVIGPHKDAVLIFGGVGENRLCSSTVYTLELGTERFNQLRVDRKSVRENLAECRRIMALMEVDAKKVGLLN